MLPIWGLKRKNTITIMLPQNICSIIKQTPCLVDSKFAENVYQRSQRRNERRQRGMRIINTEGGYDEGQEEDKVKK